VGAVDVGGVEEGDPAAEGVRDDGDAGVVVQRRVVGARQTHAPEAQLRHLQSLGAEADPRNHRGLLHGLGNGLISAAVLEVNSGRVMLRLFLRFVAANSWLGSMFLAV
jgi:hypothetical protein